MSKRTPAYKGKHAAVIAKTRDNAGIALRVLLAFVLVVTLIPMSNSNAYGDDTSAPAAEPLEQDASATSTDNQGDNSASLEATEPADTADANSSRGGGPIIH